MGYQPDDQSNPQDGQQRNRMHLHQQHQHGGVTMLRRVRLLALTTLTALVMNMVAGIAGPVQPTEAAHIAEGGGAQVLRGRDDDNLNNPTIQPAGVAANQSLDNADVLTGGGGNDVLVGLLGNDVLRGGSGNDILVGGPEGFSRPNSDVIFGDDGNDLNIWAPGDGSDAFLGGSGKRDAQILGLIDRDARNAAVPSLTNRLPGYRTGVPTVDVSGSPGVCTLERVADRALGYQFLVRFFVRQTRALAVTIRLAEVEQVFCTNEAGGTITYADLTQEHPRFVEVTLEQVKHLNRDVARLIR